MCSAIQYIVVGKLVCTSISQSPSPEVRHVLPAFCICTTLFERASEHVSIVCILAFSLALVQLCIPNERALVVRTSANYKFSTMARPSYNTSPPSLVASQTGAVFAG
jgi:hypothetical protein